MSTRCGAAAIPRLSLDGLFLEVSQSASDVEQAKPSLIEDVPHVDTFRES